jgi:hypothetical protein
VVDNENLDGRKPRLKYGSFGRTKRQMDRTDGQRCHTVIPTALRRVSTRLRCSGRTLVREESRSKQRSSKLRVNSLRKESFADNENVQHVRDCTLPLTVVIFQGSRSQENNVATQTQQQQSNREHAPPTSRCFSVRDIRAIQSFPRTISALPKYTAELHGRCVLWNVAPSLGRNSSHAHNGRGPNDVD